MTPARWIVVRELAARARELPPAEAAALLDHECGSDDMLRVEVEALLEAPADEIEPTEPSIPSAHVDPNALAGTLVDGKYEIRQLLGRGGMGSVYRAIQRSLRRTVALKIMTGRHVADPSASARFEREALAIARLKHPNIVTIHDLGSDATVGDYLVMEFVDGRSLRTEMDTAGPLRLERTLEIFAQVCAGVHAAHEAGVVHRDIKPENILLESTGEGTVAKVLDFGIAQLSSATDSGANLTGAGTVLGTPAYMSPEQCFGDDVDARSDVYSLGCVLYELLVGQPPFTAPKRMAVMRMHAAADPEPPSSRRTTIDARFDDVVLRALEKQREDRYPTAAAFAGAVARAAADTHEPRALGGTTDASSRLTSAGECIDVAPVATNLPASLNAFLGRDQQLDRVGRTLARERLVTLTGPGGIGKTRLAVEVARGATGRRDLYPDGVWLVELASIDDPSRIPIRIADALDVRDAGARDALNLLRDRLVDAKLLLVVDNCEHVVEAAAKTIDALLSVAPGLRVLATSREALGIAGEAVWRVPALDVPEPAASDDDVLASEAVRLFIDRARASGSSLVETPHLAASLAALCRRLDGLPLAIELAATRARVLSVDEILARLDDRLGLLSGGSRTAPARQRTLRAALDWSYDLLSEPERALLLRLSVFSGGWTLVEAEGAVAGTEIRARDVLDLLTRLVDKSLVVATEREGVARFFLLESIRAYALERLESRGERVDAARRHADLFLRLAERAEPDLVGADAAKWLDRLDAEYENLRAALATLRDTDGPAFVRLAAALGNFWSLRGHLADGQIWLDAARARTEAEPSGTPSQLRARILLASSVFARLRGDVSTARSTVEALLDVVRVENDRPMIVYATRTLASLVMREDLGAARVLATESLATAVETEDERAQATGLNLLGEIARGEGDFATARAHYAAALEIARRLGKLEFASTYLCNLGSAAREEGDLTEADARYREAFSIDSALGNKAGVAYSLDGLAAVAARRGAWTRAAHLAGAASALFEATGLALDDADREARERYFVRMRDALGETILDAAIDDGRSLTTDRVAALVASTAD